MKGKEKGREGGAFEIKRSNRETGWAREVEKQRQIMNEGLVETEQMAEGREFIWSHSQCQDLRRSRADGRMRGGS